jgi:hypothetical protein
VIDVEMLQKYLPKHVTVIVLEVAAIEEVGLGTVASQVIFGGLLEPCEVIETLRSLADEMQHDYGPCNHHAHE